MSYQFINISTFEGEVIERSTLTSLRVTCVVNETRWCASPNQRGSPIHNSKNLYFTQLHKTRSLSHSQLISCCSFHKGSSMSETSAYNSSHRALLQSFMSRSTFTLDEAKPVLASILSAHGTFISFFLSLHIHDYNLTKTLHRRTTYTPRRHHAHRL
jgi:hypothetical protein